MISNALKSFDFPVSHHAQKVVPCLYYSRLYWKFRPEWPSFGKTVYLNIPGCTGSLGRNGRDLAKPFTLLFPVVLEVGAGMAEFWLNL